MQRSDQNPNGIIVLTEDSMPQLARCVAGILREEFRVSSPSMKSSIPTGGADELISKAAPAKSWTAATPPSASGPSAASSFLSAATEVSTTDSAT